MGSIVLLKGAFAVSVPIGMLEVGPIELSGIAPPGTLLLANGLLCVDLLNIGLEPPLPENLSAT